MSHQLLYILGEPGVGKSALAAALVQGRSRRVHQKPFAHTVYSDGLVQLGRERGSGFSGTDALSLAVSPLAIATLETKIWPRVLAEGDRLAHAGFFAAATKAGYALEVVLIEASEGVAAERRAARGSTQDASWVSSRQTKLANLAPHVTMRLDGGLSISELAGQLADHPAIRKGEC